MNDARKFDILLGHLFMMRARLPTVLGCKTSINGGRLKAIDHLLSTMRHTEYNRTCMALEAAEVILAHTPKNKFEAGYKSTLRGVRRVVNELSRYIEVVDS